MSPCFGYFFGFYLISFFHNPVLEAALGLYISYINFFCYGLVNAMAEKLGVEAA